MLKNYDVAHKTDRVSESFSKVVIEEAELVKPIIKEQLFKEFIVGIGDTDEVFKLYCKTFDEDADKVCRMIIIKTVQPCESESLYFYRNIIEKAIGNEHVVASVTVDDRILLVTDIVKQQCIEEKLLKIHNLIKVCYDEEIFSICSEEVLLCETNVRYIRLSKYFTYPFYLSDRHTVYEYELKLCDEKKEFVPKYTEIENAVRKGDMAETEVLLKEFFSDLYAALTPPMFAKTHCLELYLCIIRCCDAEKLDKYMNGVVFIQKSMNFKEIMNFIGKNAEEIALVNKRGKQKMYSGLIEETLNVIESNIANEELSLRWIASTILYTNVDYLGKLFKKETGKNFSYYVMEMRMEMAKGMISGGKAEKIYEIASKVGYGSNPQYFSQVFKKYTGISPLEYKEYMRIQG